MRIISRGVNPNEYLWEGTCGYCNTKFECLQHEGTIQSDQRDGTFLKVACPVCIKMAFAYKTKRTNPRALREPYQGPG